MSLAVGSGSDPVRWGVLGCARVFERRMVPGFANAAEAATLLAIASRSEEKAIGTAARCGIPRAYGSYDELLQDPDIEAVYLPLPNDQHAFWTLRALAAGKHVLCDKPAALSYHDAVRMAEAARSAKKRLMEGFMYRYHPQHARVLEIVASGEIGAICHFSGTFTYPADRSAPNIRWNAAQGGGALLDTGVYPLDAARRLMGSTPEAVSASSLWSRADCEGVDLRTAALLEWADGRTAAVLCGFDQPFVSRYDVRGETGVIEVPRAFQIGETGVDITIRLGNDDSRTETWPHRDQYAHEIAHFSACVRDPARSLAPGEDGMEQARLVEAVCRAARERRRVPLAEIVG